MTQISKKALKDLAKALDTRIDHKTPTQATITLATVIKAVKGDYWVQLDGAATSTPAVSSTVAVSVGDRVQVRIQDGKLTITGNATQQATNVAETVSIVEPIADTAEAAAQTAKQATKTAAQAKDVSKAAQTAAEQAQEIAQATDQHFWSDDNGVHVTTSNKSTTGSNLLANSQGIMVRRSDTPLTAMTKGGFTVYDGEIVVDENDSLDKHIIASMTTSGLQIYDADNNLMLDVHDERDAYSGMGIITERVQCIKKSPYSTITLTYDLWNGSANSITKLTSESGTVLDKDELISSLSGKTITLLIDSLDYVYVTYITTDTQAKSYTLGTRSGNVGGYSYVEGYENEASGLNSHSEGRGCIASGARAHAQNYGTIAASQDQTAIGRHNIKDSENKYALIIGNGDVEKPSNALTIDWDGNLTIAGKLTATGGGGGGSYTAGIGLNLSGSEFSLKPSSNVNLGGVVVGANINIEDGGIISVANGTTDKAGVLQLGTQSTMAAQGNHTHADKVDVSDYTSRQNYIDKQFTGLGVDIDDCQDSITEITNKLTAIADSEIENL